MNIGFVYAIGAAIVWGLVYAIDQKILADIKPLTLLFVGSVLTALIMLPFIFFDSGSIKTLFEPGKKIWGLITISMILAALANFLIYSGIKNLDASTASIIEIAYPFFVVFFSYILYRSTPNVYFFLGGILIFAGTFIIIKLA